MTEKSRIHLEPGDSIHSVILDGKSLIVITHQGHIIRAALADIFAPASEAKRLAEEAEVIAKRDPAHDPGLAPVMEDKINLIMENGQWRRMTAAELEAASLAAPPADPGLVAETPETRLVPNGWGGYTAMTAAEIEADLDARLGMGEEQRRKVEADYETKFPHDWVHDAVNSRPGEAVRKCRNCPAWDDLRIPIDCLGHPEHPSNRELEVPEKSYEIAAARENEMQAVRDRERAIQAEHGINPDEPTGLNPQPMDPMIRERAKSDHPHPQTIIPRPEG